MNKYTIRHTHDAHTLSLFAAGLIFANSINMLARVCYSLRSLSFTTIIFLILILYISCNFLPFFSFNLNCLNSLRASYFSFQTLFPSFYFYIQLYLHQFFIDVFFFFSNLFSSHFSFILRSTPSSFRWTLFGLNGTLTFYVLASFCAIYAGCFL
jgi:hypothetical protein